MAIKFMRRTRSRYIKLGKNSKKKQKWKRPTGRDNKMREKRRGYPAIVSIGYRTDKEKRNLVKGKVPVLVYNVKDLEKAGKENVIVIGKIGNKKKMEIVKEAKKKKLSIYNIKSGKESKK